MAGGYLNTPANSPGLFAGADPDAQIKQQQIAATDTFRNGLPTDASGNIDYNAAAKALLQKGAYGPAKDLIGVGISQQGIQLGLKAADDLAGTGVAPTTAAAPSKAANAPAPVIYQGALDKTVDGALSPKALYDHYIANGATKNEALMLTSAAASESNLNPTAVHDGGIGYGLFGHNGDRLAAMQQDAASKTPTWQQQALFGLKDLRSRPESALVNNAKSVDDLAIAQMHFERPKGYTPDNPMGGQNYDGRLGTLRKFAGLTAQPAAAAAAPGLGPMAYTSTNQPVQTDAQGRALNPLTNTPTQPGPIRPPAPAAPPANSVAPASAPVPDSAPSSIHPFGPSAAPTAEAPAAAPTLQANPGATRQTSSSAIDPTLGGLLKGPWVGNPGGYASALRAQSVRLGTLGNTSAAEAYNKQADAVERGIERNNIVTNEMKNYEVARQQGYQGSMMDFARDLEAQKAGASGQARVEAENSPVAIKGAGQRAQAEAEARAGQELVAVQPVPGGPVQYVPKSQVLASNQPVVKEQPKFITQRQGALAKQEGDMLDQFQQRQITKERIDAMTNLLETFQTGAGAEQKAAALATARALGFNIPDSATANPAAVEQFSKNTTANIFSQARALGGPVLVSELAGLQKSNANAGMQPASNASILAQQKGLLNWQDAHDQAYFDWKRSNPNAFDPSSFEQQWAKANPASGYVSAARKEIAALGEPLPPKQHLVDGQAYMVRGQKVRWNAGLNGFERVASPHG